MKKMALCLALTVMVFAYEMNAEIYRGTWTVTEESEHSKSVTAGGDTVIGLNQFNLEEGQSLIINHEDAGNVRFIVKKEETIIDGSIETNCNFEFATTGFLSLDVEANLVGRQIKLETGRGLSFAGDIKADEIEMRSKGLVLFTGSAEGNTKLISDRSVTVDGEMQAVDGTISIQGSELQIMGISKLDVSGKVGGHININVDQLLHEDDAQILATGIGRAGRIEITTKDTPELFGHLSVESTEGEGGVIQITCVSGEAECANSCIQGLSGKGQFIIKKRDEHGTN